METLRRWFDSRMWLGALFLTGSAQGGVLPEGTSVGVLDSGLTVIAVPLSTPDLVAVQIWMEVGSRHETESGSTGYAHFAEHLLFRGSENFSAEAREQRAEHESPNKEQNAGKTWADILEPGKCKAVENGPSDWYCMTVCTSEQVEREKAAVDAPTTAQVSAPAPSAPPALSAASRKRR